MRYIDPTGHRVEEDVYATGKSCDQKLKKSKPCKDKRDLTEWMPTAATYIATDAEMQKVKKLNSGGTISKIVGAAKFYSLVHNKARFDVKHVMRADLGSTIKLGDNWYEYSTPGNILYGFYGREVGYSPEMLHFGAGVAQVIDVGGWAFKSAASSSYRQSHDFPGLGYFDATDDAHAVDLGIEMYDNSYNDGNFTEAEFKDELKDFKEGWGLARQESPGDCIPNKTGPYAPDRFDYPQ